MSIDSEKVRNYLRQAYESSLDDLYHANRDLGVNSGYFNPDSFLDRACSGEARDALGDIMGQVEEQFLLTAIPNEKFKNLKDLKGRLVWFAEHLRKKRDNLLGRIEEYKMEYSRASDEIPEPLHDAIGLIETYLTATKTALDMDEIKNLDSVNNLEVGMIGALEGILSRFSVFLKTLELERRKEAGVKRAAYKVNDEYDVQDMLGAILKLSFDDVRREEPCPSFGPNKSRCDLYIASHGVFIEIKTTLTKNPKTVFDDFKTDIPDYLKHEGCKTLILFTYDPEGLITNKTQFDELKKIKVVGTLGQVVIVFS